MSQAPFNARRRLSPGSLAFVGVVGVGIVGVLLAAAGLWRQGSWVIGGAVLLAGLARLVLPDRSAGMLRVRRKSLDVGLLLLLATLITLVTLAIRDRV